MKRLGALLAVTLVALCLRLVEVRAQTFSVVHNFGVLTNVTGFSPMAPLVQGPDGTLYGTTTATEGDGYGTVFKVQPDGTGLIALKLFTAATDGSDPTGSLLLNGNTLYGTTRSGGSAGNGSVFKINTDGSGYAVLKTFDNSADGIGPSGSLVLNGSALYGTAENGGASSRGTLFSVNTNGSGFTVVYNFGTSNTDGTSPQAGLALSGSTLYGTTEGGGNAPGFSPGGTIFKINTDGSNYAILKTFTGTDGQSPIAGLLLNGSTLYGTTFFGGSQFVGTVFSISTSGSNFQVLRSFTGLNGDGAKPASALVLSGSTLYGTTTAGGALGNSGTVFAVSTDGSTYQVLKSFANTTADGGDPSPGLVLSGSTLFGTTSAGGSSGNGTVFKINTNGSGSTLLASFGFSDAVNPNASLQVSGNTLYGTTSGGGAGQSGTVFKINLDGTGYQVVHSFSTPVNTTNSDGARPNQAALVLSTNTLYGTAQVGGSFGFGTVFAVNTDGTGFTVLHNFSNATNDGAFPAGGLLLSGNTLYGTTTTGDGNSGLGSVFKINTDGSGYTLLKSFSSSDGATPQATLVLSGSTLYGTTAGGGPSQVGSIFKVNTDGSGFVNLMSYSSSGTLGLSPQAGLVVSGASLYGTTFSGGTSGSGTIFTINTNGTGFAVLHNFTVPNGSNVNADGTNPQAVLALNGSTLYGTASSGGAGGNGTVYQINTNGTGFTVLHNFSASPNGVNNDGRLPFSGMVWSGTTLYGTTGNGGSLDDGIIFSITFALNIQLSGNSVVLSWTNSAFGLQSAPTVTSTFTNIPSATSPYSTPVSGTQQYFRLKAN